MTDMPPHAAAPQPPSRSGALKGLLILDTIATILLAPLALFWAGISVMSSTTTTDTAFVNLYIWVNLAIPISMVICLIAGWVLFARRRESAAWKVIFLPLIPFLISILMMATFPD